MYSDHDVEGRGEVDNDAPEHRTEPRRRTGAVVARQLARQYEAARKAAGFTQTTAAKALGWSLRKQQLLEAGDQLVSRKDLAVIFPTFGIPDAEHDGWRDLVAGAREKDWWDAYGEEDLPADLKRFIGLEQGAVRIRAFSPTMVNWLLQTDAYRARAMAGSLAPRPVEQIAALVEITRRRQRVLDEAEPLELWSVLDEAALLRGGVDAEVMAAQRAHLVERAAAPHVTIQVVPLSAGIHSGLTGGFAHFEFGWPGDLGLVYLDQTRPEPTLLGSRRDIYAYSRLFDQLAALALPPVESVELIRDIAGPRPA